MRAGGSATVEPAWVRGMPSARARRFSGAKCASAAVGYSGSQEGNSAQRSCLAGGEATGGFHYGRVVTAAHRLWLERVGKSMHSFLDWGGLFLTPISDFLFFSNCGFELRVVPSFNIESCLTNMTPFFSCIILKASREICINRRTSTLKYILDASQEQTKVIVS